MLPLLLETMLLGSCETRETLQGLDTTSKEPSCLMVPMVLSLLGLGATTTLAVEAFMQDSARLGSARQAKPSVR